MHKNQKAFTLLKLIINPYDRVALRCWLGFDDEHLCCIEYRTLMDYCKNNGGHPKDVLDLVTQQTIQLEGIQKLISRYEDLLRLQEESSGKTSREVIEKIFPITEGWTIPFQEAFETYLDLDLDIIYKNLMDTVIHPNIPLDVEFIRIMSIYRSKGLDSRFVIITGCIEGWIPQYLASEEKVSKNITDKYAEEQRRIFYVAITRASEELLISSFSEQDLKSAYSSQARFTHIPGNSQTCRIFSSTLLAELGQECPKSDRGDSFLTNL